MKPIFKLFIFLFLIMVAGTASASNITFTTTGATFSPRINVTGTPEILWTFGDGSTSTSTSPDINYGTSETRKTNLTVTPWRNLTQINLGYAGADGGSIPNVTILRLSTQAVSNVEGLENAAPGLQYWAACGNDVITELNFSEFTNLKVVEMFSCGNLAKVTLKNNTNLTRICIEDDKVSELDFRDSPKLEDLRLAQQDTENFSLYWGDYNYTALWHICIHDNDILTPIPFEHLVYVRELLMWNCNQTGTIKLYSTNMNSIQLYNNHYTVLDFSGYLPAGKHTAMVARDNNVKKVIFNSTDVGISNLDLRNNSLNMSEVDEILRKANSTASGADFANVKLTGNAVPSSKGFSYVANITARGDTVTTATVSGKESRIIARINAFINYLKNMELHLGEVSWQTL